MLSGRLSGTWERSKHRRPSIWNRLRYKTTPDRLGANAVHFLHWPRSSICLAWHRETSGHLHCPYPVEVEIPECPRNGPRVEFRLECLLGTRCECRQVIRKPTSQGRNCWRQARGFRTAPTVCRPAFRGNGQKKALRKPTQEPLQQ